MTMLELTCIPQLGEYAGKENKKGDFSLQNWKEG